MVENASTAHELPEKNETKNSTLYNYFNQSQNSAMVEIQ